MDYATLTGSARAGLGPDIPAMFSNNEEVAQDIQKLAKKTEDPVWNMPLWQPYRKYLDSSNADIINSTGQAGDGIYSALFLETLLKKIQIGCIWIAFHGKCQVVRAAPKARQILVCARSLRICRDGLGKC